MSTCPRNMSRVVLLHSAPRALRSGRPRTPPRDLTDAGRTVGRRAAAAGSLGALPKLRGARTRKRAGTGQFLFCVSSSSLILAYGSQERRGIFRVCVSVRRHRRATLFALGVSASGSDNFGLICGFSRACCGHLCEVSRLCWTDPTGRTRGHVTLRGKARLVTLRT